MEDIFEIETHCYHKRCNWFSNNVKNVNLRRGIMRGLANFVDIFFSLKIRNDGIFDSQSVIQQNEVEF